MKRQAKNKNDLEYENILAKGVELYDESLRDVLYCSYYKKSINSLNLYELVLLDKEYPELFTKYHKIRYSMLMLGEVGDIQNYKGMTITPDDIRNL
jgi:hypothetical protein